MSKNDAKNVPEVNTENTAPALGFKVAKNLTLPLLKMKPSQPVYIRIDSEIKIGKKVEEKKDPAIICEVTDLITGEKLQFLVPAVLQGVLHDDFGAPKFGKTSATDPVSELVPANNPSYVGQAFALTDLGTAEGKKYKGISIQLLELAE